MNQKFLPRVFQNKKKIALTQPGVHLFMLLWILLLAAATAFGQSTPPPRHTRLLYSADLLSADPANPIGQIVSSNGSFVAGKGWTASNTNGQLRINLAEALPFEGTAEITISNLNPHDQMYKQLKLKTAYTPFSLWSRPRFGYGALYSTMGSYLYLMSETNPKYNFDYKSNWKVLSQGFYGRGPRENSAPYGDYTKSEPDSDKAVMYYTNKEYKFKLIWSIGKAWVTIEDTVLQEHNFNGQIESFRYLCMGMNEMGLSLVGPIYKNVRIYAPESPVVLDNVSVSTGVASNAVLGARGICWADINKDGLEDAFIPYTGLMTAKPSMLLIHTSNHTFANEASARGVASVPSARVAAFADVDGDGDHDLFIGTDRDGTFLYLNNGQGTFQDASASRGISDKGMTTGTRQLLVLDIDGDADLDLLVVTTALTRLYLNNGQGTFSVTDRGINSALSSVGTVTQGVAAGDVTMDGAVDLVFTRAGQAPLLLVNDGKGQFSSESSMRGLTFIYAPNDPTLVDYDNDGDLDLFVANQARNGGAVQLVSCYKNDGSGHFTDLSNTLNLQTDAKALLPIDVNNDGLLDFFALRHNMDPSSADYAFRNISKLFMQQAGGVFSEQAGTGAEINFAGIQAGAVVDYNQDGKQDLAGIAYGGSHTDIGPMGTIVDEFGRQYLLQNKTAGRHYLQIALKDSSGSVCKTEARVWIYQAGKAGQEGYLLGYRDSGSHTNPQSHSSPILHFGLGENTACDIVVRYATSASVTLSHVSADRQVAILRPARVAEAGSLVRMSPEKSSGPAGGLARDSVVVKVLDTDQLPLAGHPVVFRIIEGQGFINGTTGTEAQVRTDSRGLAKVAWQLDSKSGGHNRLSAEAVNSAFAHLNGSPLYFTADVYAADPAILHKIAEADSLSGPILTTLPRPFQVRVTDLYDNPVVNHPVLFQVQSAQGHLNGNRSISMLTDEMGMAQATLTLGSTPGFYSVSASSMFNGVALSQSPLQFQANAFSFPSLLKYVSGDSGVGIINQMLSQPLKVQVTDEQSNPISGHTVRFTVLQGGGTFAGQTFTDVSTDRAGIAAARPALGSTAGPGVNIFEAEAYTDSQHALLGSPVRFAVSAKKTAAAQLVLISGNEQSGQAEAVLTNPLEVRVLDQAGQPVAGHEVQFSVVQGSGVLGASLTRAASVTTGENGNARISFRLGRELGVNQHAVEVASSDGIGALQNSGSRFTASALFGQPDSLLSEISSTTPVTADGVAGATIVVRLLDEKKNPVPGEHVMLYVDGSDNVMEQPLQPTDSRGETRGALRSTRAELKTVTARVKDSQTRLKNAAAIQFVADAPARLVFLSGNKQHGIINSALPNLLVLQVLDRFNNPVPDVPITLQPYPASGRIEPVMALNSDWSGRIQVQWILGSATGLQRVRLSSAGVPDLLAVAQASLPSHAQMIKVKGDGQFSEPTAFFTDSLQVRIQTADGAPIFGIPVHFTVIEGSASVQPGSPVYSDQAGLCGVRLQAGSSLGPCRIKASVDDSLQVIFTVSVGVAVPARLVQESADWYSAVVNTVIKNISFRVVDLLDKPVSGATVSCTLSADGGQVLTPQPLYTDQQGRASVDIKVGTKSGLYALSLVCSGLLNAPLHLTLQALPGMAAKIVAVSGNHQQARGNELLLYPLTVKVQDQYDNEVPRIPVHMAVTSGGGRLIGDMALSTDSTGTVSMFWQLGVSGEQAVTAASEMLPGQAALFTAQLLANQPPTLTVVADTTIQETRTLILTVRALDPEGGNVDLRVANLPEGAIFDPVNGKAMVWTPTLRQQGDYAIEIMATDENGGLTTKHVTIHVINRNQLPTIHVTPDSSYLALQYYRPYIFSVNAQDPDNDALSFRWQLDGMFVGNQATMAIMPTPAMKSNFNLELLVKDCCDSVRYTWNAHIMTFVELNEFRVTSERGVCQLSWISAQERNNAGFFLLSGFSADGPFTRINESIIGPRSDRHYEFRDVARENGQKHFYMLQAVALDGSIQEFGPIAVVAEQPTRMRLEQNYPNPFNPQTTIAYQIDALQNIDVVIYDVLGRTVRTLYRGHVAPGYYQLIWDGCNDRGQAMPSGLYHGVLAGPSARQIIKLLLMK